MLYRVHASQASQRRRGAPARVPASRRASPDRRPRSDALASRGRARVAGRCRRERSTRPRPMLPPLRTSSSHAASSRAWGGAARSRAARDLARLARSNVRSHPRSDSRTSPATRSRIRGAGRAGATSSTGARRTGATAKPRRGWPGSQRLGSPSPIRVAAVFPEPTPYRAPLLDRIATLPDIDLTVVYAADTVARRTWRVEPKHRAVFLRGLRVPGAQKILHHDYPLTPGIVRALTDARPAVVVVSGWSTFAAQAAITWCGLTGVPYVLVVESHDEGPRAAWRRGIKGTVDPVCRTSARRASSSPGRSRATR